MSATAEFAAIGRIADKLREEPEVGSLRIVGVAGTPALGSEGEPVLRFVITLADPQEGSETWATEDVHRLLRRVVEAAVADEAELPPPVVELQPEHPEPAAA